MLKLTSEQKYRNLNNQNVWKKLNVVLQIFYTQKCYRH